MKDWNSLRTYSALTLLVAVILAVFVAGVMFVEIETASVANGEVVIDFEKKTVQHLEGGIVKKIHVKNGDEVKIGQTLVTLQGKQIGENVKSAKFTERFLRIKMARLLHQLQGELFEIDEFSNTPNKVEKDVYFSEQSLYRQQKKVLENQEGKLLNNIKMMEFEIESLTKQNELLQKKRATIAQELEIIEKLMESGNATITRFLELQRQLQEVDIVITSNRISVQKSEKEIRNYNFELNSVRTEYESNLHNQLEDSRREISRLQNEMNNAMEVESRTEIVATTSGVVRNLQVFTIGGVLRPAQEILDIVPQDDLMLVQIKIRPKDIDIVHEGITASLSMTAYDTKVLPKLMGKVVYIDPYITKQDTTGETYYLARVVVSKKEQQKIPNLKLYPGMPVDAFVLTGRKSFGLILFGPLIDQLNRAFKG